MSFTLSRREIAAAGVIALVFSPIIIAGGILAAGPYAAHYAYHKRKYRKECERNAPMTPFQKYMAQLGSTEELNAALQKLHDTALKSPSYPALCDLAFALISLKDYNGALKVFDEGEQYVQGEIDRGNFNVVATGKYFHAVAAQQLRDFAKSVELLRQATDFAERAAGVFGLFDDGSKGVNVEMARTHLAYNLYLFSEHHAMYKKLKGEAVEPLSADDRLKLLAEAILLLTKSVEEATGVDTVKPLFLRAMCSWMIHLAASEKCNDFMVHDEHVASAERDLRDALSIVQSQSPGAKQDFDEFSVPEKFDTDEKDMIVEGLVDAITCEVPECDIFALLAQVVAVRDTPEALREARKYLFLARPNEFSGPYIPQRFDDWLAKRLLDDNGRDAMDWVKQVRWPLRYDSVADEYMTHHNLEPHFFKSPTYCDYCMHWLGLQDGYRCSQCNYEVHAKNCFEKCKTHYCLDTRSAYHRESTTHTHVFVKHRVHRIRDCFVCKKFMMIGKTAAQCQGCNHYVHLDCLDAGSPIGATIITEKK